MWGHGRSPRWAAALTDERVRRPADSARHSARTEGSAEIGRSSRRRTPYRRPRRIRASAHDLLNGQRVRARPYAGGPMTSTLDDRSTVDLTTPATAVTPRLELSVTRALEGYDALVSTLPGTAVHYAVKANPHPVLLRALAQAGGRFDVAGQAETDVCLAAGAAPEDLVFSNPVKRRADVESAGALRGPALRRRLTGGDAEGGRGGPGCPRALPPGDLRRGLGLAAVAEVRLLDRRGRRRPAARRLARARPGRRELPRRVPAARPAGVARPHRRRRPGSSRRCVPTACTRTSSTSAVASPPRTRAAPLPCTATRRRSTPSWATRSAPTAPTR